MNLINHISDKVTTETYEIDDNGKKYTYIEYLNEKGKLIDCSVRNEVGGENSDAALLEKIQNFVDSLN